MTNILILLILVYIVSRDYLVSRKAKEEEARKKITDCKDKMDAERIQEGIKRLIEYNARLDNRGVWSCGHYILRNNGVFWSGFHAHQEPRAWFSGPDPDSVIRMLDKEFLYHLRVKLIAQTWKPGYNNAGGKTWEKTLELGSSRYTIQASVHRNKWNLTTPWERRTQQITEWPENLGDPPPGFGLTTVQDTGKS